MGKNILKEKSFTFAVKIMQLYPALSLNKHEYILSKQVLRSGTSIGAMIREAQNAESKADFVHKLAIAQKECDESLYWLELLFHSGFLRENEFKTLHFEAGELLKMIRSAILTTKSTTH